MQCLPGMVPRRLRKYIPLNQNKLIFRGLVGLVIIMSDNITASAFTLITTEIGT